MKILLGLIYGSVYGASHVVPGLSGGTFLVIFGCYETVCEAFALNFKEIKKHFLFLLFFGIGTVGGFIGFVHAIVFFLERFEIQTALFFIGVILGGIPLIIRLATEEEKLRPSCLLPFFLGLALVVSLFLLELFGVFSAGIAQDNYFVFFVKILVYFIVAGVAMVMPGVSGAFILVAFGVYDMCMEAIKGFDFMILLPSVIGAIIGIIVGAKLVLLLIRKYKLMVYSVITGMVVGSLAPLLPSGLALNMATVTGIICLLLGGLVAVFLGKRESSNI